MLSDKKIKGGMYFSFCIIQRQDKYLVCIYLANVTYVNMAY